MPAATPLPRGPSVLTLYSAADLLTAPGCPVCRYAIEASDRYLRWFALEGHSQPGTIAQLCTSLGMCGMHTRRLMSQPGSAVRLTAVFRYVVTAAREQLAERPHPLAGCPGCQHDNAATNRALDTLLGDLTDSAVLDRCQELGGLCLAHFAAVAATARPWLVAPLAETVQHVIADRRTRCDWLAGADHDAETRALLRRSVSAGSQRQVACTPCFAGARAELHALAQLPGSAANGPDPAVVLCASHLADAAVAARADGLRPLLAWQAQCATSGLQTGQSRWRRKTSRRPDIRGNCTVCKARQVATEHVLAEVHRHLRQDATAPVLCVRHDLTLRAADPRATRELTRRAFERANWLAAELADAFDRTATAHSRGVRAPESSAWQRAAVFLDGSVLGGLSYPLPADPLGD